MDAEPAATAVAEAAGFVAATECPFSRIVCGIDGSRQSHEGARQAAALVRPGGQLELVAVTEEWGARPAAGGVLDTLHARRALEAVARELRGGPADVNLRMVSGRPPWRLLLDAATGADLLVVARHSHSRFGGIAIGRTATELVHRAAMPLLVAVARRSGTNFPGRILVAADGPGHPERAVRIAGRVACSTGSDITLVRLNSPRRTRRPELAAAVAELAAVGVEPDEIVMAGMHARQIPEIALRERAGLVVVGSRGLIGPRAVASASERIAHTAPCSVLVVRPPVRDL